MNLSFSQYAVGVCVRVNGCAGGRVQRGPMYGPVNRSEQLPSRKSISRRSVTDRYFMLVYALEDTGRIREEGRCVSNNLRGHVTPKCSTYSRGNQS